MQDSFSLSLKLTICTVYRESFGYYKGKLLMTDQSRCVLFCYPNIINTLVHTFYYY